MDGFIHHLLAYSLRPNEAHESNTQVCTVTVLLIVAGGQQLQTIQGNLAVLWHI